MRPTASPAPTFALGNCARAQYDIFANPRHSAAEGIPYVVVIQSDLLDALATRMTIPLAAMKFDSNVPAVLCPAIIVKAQTLRAVARYAAPLPATRLRRPVENLATQARGLVAAMGEAMSAI